MLFLLLFLALYLSVYRFTTLFRFFPSWVHLLFKYPFSPTAASPLSFWQQGCAFRFCLCSGPQFGFLQSNSASVISPLGYILPGCREVLPSACLFSGSLGFTPKCGWAFFSKGIHTLFFPFWRATVPVSAENHFMKEVFKYFFMAESEPPGFSNCGFILLYMLNKFCYRDNIELHWKSL